MPTSQTLGSGVLNNLVERTLEFINTVYSGLMGSWPGLTIVTVYVIFVGYAVLMGHAGQRWKSWATSAFLVTVLSTVSHDFGTFQNWVIDPVLGMMKGGAALAATGGGGAGDGPISQMLDDAGANIGKMMAVLDEIDLPGNFIVDAWLYIKVGAVVFVMAVLGCFLYLAMVALTCVAVFSVLMMLMVGGPCLFLASFDGTRHIFTAWVRATLNYVLWVFFLAAVGGIGNYYIGITADALMKWDVEANGVFTEAVGGNMLLTGLCLYMLTKTADWAAAITGGTATQTGILGAVGGLAGSAMGSAIGAAGGAIAPTLGNAAKGAGYIGGNAAGRMAYRAFSAMRGIGK